MNLFKFATCFGFEIRKKILLTSFVMSLLFEWRNIFNLWEFFGNWVLENNNLFKGSLKYYVVLFIIMIRHSINN